MASRATAPPTPPQAPLRLRVGTLSMPGATPAQAARIGDALRRELEVLLASTPSGQLGASRHRERVDGGTVSLSSTDRPEAIGRRLARAIARGLRDLGESGDAA